MKQTILHNRACTLLGIDPANVRLVGPAEYKLITGRGIGRTLGIASWKDSIYYVRRGQPNDVYIHELLHVLFKSRPHWWIYAAAWKLAGIPSKSHTYGYGHAYSVSGTTRIKESRAKLLALARQAAKRRGVSLIVDT